MWPVMDPGGGEQKGQLFIGRRGVPLSSPRRLGLDPSLCGTNLESVIGW